MSDHTFESAAPHVEAAFAANPVLAMSAVNWQSLLELGLKYGPELLDDLALVFPAPWSTGLHTIAKILRGLTPQPTPTPAPAA